MDRFINSCTSLTPNSDLNTQTLYINIFLIQCDLHLPRIVSINFNKFRNHRKTGTADSAYF